MSIDKEPNLARRRFIRKTSILATIYFAGSFTLLRPKEAHAVIPDVPGFIIGWIEKAKDWYDETGKGIYKEVSSYLDLLKSPGALSAIAAATDAVNKVKGVTTERHAKRIAEGNPSEGCAQEASSTAAAATEESLQEALAIEAADNAKAYIDGLRESTATQALDFERAIASEINEYESLQSLLESMDARDFVSDNGYIEGESGNMDLYRRVTTLYPRRALMAMGNQQNDRVLEKSITAYSRLTVIENAMDFLFTRRLRSAEAYTQAHGASDEYEKDILDGLAHPAGDSNKPSLAVVDLEAFEVQRTHLSGTWQDMVAECVSDVALNKEITVLATHSNLLDYRIYETRRRINEVRGIKTLAALDTPRMPARNDAITEEQEEEEVLLFGM